MIVADRQGSGLVCCSVITEDGRLTQLDIWLGAKAHCSKGYGLTALDTLCVRLLEKYGVRTFVTRPCMRNRRAITARKKAGFDMLSLLPADQMKRFAGWDCEDAIVLLKRFG